MRVTIPDTVLAPYEEIATQQGRAVDMVVTDQLKRFAHLTPGTRAVVISEKALQDLALPLGALPIRDGADLVARCRRHASITFEGLDIGLTPGQKAELQHRAERQGKPVEALIQEMATLFLRDFFYSSGGGEAAPIRKVS